MLTCPVLVNMPGYWKLYMVGNAMYMPSTIPTSLLRMCRPLTPRSPTTLPRAKPTYYDSTNALILHRLWNILYYVPTNLAYRESSSTISHLPSTTTNVLHIPSCSLMTTSDCPCHRKGQYHIYRSATLLMRNWILVCSSI